MEWYINDLSLNGDFADHHALRNSIEPLLRLMARRRDLRRRILCSRTLSMRSATASMNLAAGIRATRDQVFIGQALAWLSTGGPFWEDDRATNPDDLFHFENEDVTNQGLGEAARKLILELDAGTFSFPNAAVARFERTPLRIDHGFREQPFGSYDVDNCWDSEVIEATEVRSPQSWGEMLEIRASEMNGLTLSAEIADQLAPVPFHSGVAQKFLLLLRVLQKLTEETRDGALTAAGLELLNKYFVGEKALFTDESKSNKQDFSRELTFPDPSNRAGSPLFCPWHGKVKFGSQYRIHFEWPRVRGQQSIKVVYIGPKITKH